jgi:hypothetical protein
MEQLFEIGFEKSYTLRSNGTPYFICRYTNEYCEDIFAWKVICISEQNYWDNLRHQEKIVEKVFYERDFVEYNSAFSFKVPPRKPSLKTKLINERIDKIINCPEQINNLLGKGYNLYSGLIKEELIREFLVELLNIDLKDNVDIKIGTGFIVNHINKKKSKQIDIIVYKDSNDTNTFCCGGFIITEPKNVFATIEIKTDLNKTELLGDKKSKTGALANQHSITELDDNEGRHIIKSIIGYNKGKFKDELFNEWISEFYKDKKVDKENIFKTFPNLIATLDGFCVNFGLQYPNFPSLFYSNSQENISGFQIFYISLLGELVKLGLKVNNIGQYLNMLPDEDYRDDNPLGINWKGIKIYCG